MISASRYHDISCGHRVAGHESKCKHLHGHNYRFHFEVVGDLDDIGRVLDFGVIKSRLCMWLEEFWDHKLLIWYQDPMAAQLVALDPDGTVLVPFNPTAENMAAHIGIIIAPHQLEGTGTRVIEVRIEETRKCSATWRDRK